MKLVAFGLGIVLICACKKDSKPSLTKTDLQGKWKLTEAFRNEKQTQTLSGAYYQFQDSVLTTNIFGEEFSAAYKIENMEVVQHIPMEIRYKVTKNPDQSLGFLTMIDGIPFRFILKKE